MAKAQILARTLAVGVALLLLAGAPSDVVVRAQSQSNGLVGTWFIEIPGGLTGFYTYHQDGTMIGTVSTMFGALPQPPGPINTNGPDHGLWRQVGGGFQVVIHRFLYNLGNPSIPVGDPTAILAIRMALTLDDQDSASGKWVVDLWFCPDGLSCPDPNTTPPDVTGISPGPGFDTLTQTRVRFR